MDRQENRLAEIVRKSEKHERDIERRIAERENGAVAMAHKKLVKYIERQKQAFDDRGKTAAQCLGMRSNLEQDVEKLNRARDELAELKRRLSAKENEVKEMEEALKHHRKLYGMKRLEAHMRAISHECLTFLVAVTPVPGDSAHIISMCSEYLNGGCRALRAMNDVMLDTVSDGFSVKQIAGMARDLQTAWSTIIDETKSNNAETAWNKLMLYMGNWRDAQQPLAELARNRAGFRAKLDDDWSAFIAALDSAARHVADMAEACGKEKPSPRPVVQSAASKPGKAEDRKGNSRAKRRKLLSLRYNDDLTKYGYEVMGDQEVIKRGSATYRLTAPKVVEIVNKLIYTLCINQKNPFIRFTSNDTKNFTRDAYKRFYDECIVRKTRRDKCDSSVIVHEPYARLRLPEDR